MGLFDCCFLSMSPKTEVFYYRKPKLIYTENGQVIITISICCRFSVVVVTETTVVLSEKLVVVISQVQLVQKKRLRCLFLSSKTPETSRETKRETERIILGHKKLYKNKTKFCTSEECNSLTKGVQKS